MASTWVLVGDGSHARLFQSDASGQPLRLLRRLDREHSREKTDRAESHDDHGEHAFARHIAGELESGRERGAFTRLVLVAAPRFLGQLRSELQGPLAACVVRSLDKDYTHMSEGELAKHIDIS